MAQKVYSIAFKNATIDTTDDTITEYLKDETKTYSLSGVLKDFDGIDGLTVTIKQADEMPSKEDEA